jgi:transporter family-2 protein
MLAPDPEPEQPAEPEQPLQEFSGAHLSLAPSAAGYRYPEWWAWLGGIVGSTALVGSVAIAPLISFTAVATINSAGQLISSLLVDHFGFLGIQRRRLSVRRVIGATEMLLGCVGASLESSAAATTTATAAATARSPLVTLTLAMIYMLTRMGQPVQACINTRLSSYLPSPSGPLAGMVSFSVGSLGVFAACAVLFIRQPSYLRQSLGAFKAFRSVHRSPTGLRWWMLLGGIPGCMGTCCSVFLTKSLTATLYFNLMTAGGLSGSMLFDAYGVFGSARRPTTFLRFASVLVTYLGTLLAVDAAPALAPPTSTAS